MRALARRGRGEPSEEDAPALIYHLFPQRLAESEDRSLGRSKGLCRPQGDCAWSNTSERFSGNHRLMHGRRMRLTFPVHRVPRRAPGPSQLWSLEPGGTNHFTACAQESCFPPGEPGQQGPRPPKAGREQTLEGPLSSGTPSPSPSPRSLFASKGKVGTHWLRERPSVFHLLTGSLVSAQN